MGLLATIISAFKESRVWGFEGVVPGTGVESWRPEPAPDVDNVRERYSASRYIEHLKAAMDGDFTGRREWTRFIRSLPEDERRRFELETDALIEEGALVHVLTSEQMAEVRQAVLDKAEEYRAQSNGLMKDYGVDPATMNAITHGTYVEPEQEWPEDLEDEVDLSEWGEEGDDDARE